MSDFSDRPFVAGSLIGLRAFSVDGLGRLVGPSFGGIFGPGENEAKCGGDTELGHMQAALTQSLRSLRAVRVEIASGTSTAATVRPKNPKHTVGGENCSCGYYAYFNGDNNYAQSDRVSALVEGYGVCTVGERGFRASKAKLVALVLPDRTRKGHPWDGVADWADDHEGISIAGGVIGPFLLGVLSVVPFSEGLWPVGALMVLLGILSASLIPLTFHGQSRKFRALTRPKCARETGPRVDVALIRRNYPDVPVYRSVKAALAAHPLTPPPPPPSPTPDDEDFWTREVPR